VLSLCHTRFRLWWHWDGKPAILQSRCIDETGYTQPSIGQLVGARGLKGKFGSLYHNNAIQSWAVNSDGSVKNVRHVG
jgi:sulfane dehydrogenase subunit SoxC